MRINILFLFLLIGGCSNDKEFNDTTSKIIKECKNGVAELTIRKSDYNRELTFKCTYTVVDGEVIKPKINSELGATHE